MIKTGSALRINLSAVVYQEDGVWLAHCLELDIVAEGADPDDAVRSLIGLCDLQIKVALDDGDVRVIFRPAPPEVWKLFAGGKPRLLADNRRSLRAKGFTTCVDRFEVREMAFAASQALP